jgi:hypothetical protein
MNISSFSYFLTDKFNILHFLDRTPSVGLVLFYSVFTHESEGRERAGGRFSEKQ